MLKIPCALASRRNFLFAVLVTGCGTWIGNPGKKPPTGSSSTVQLDIQGSEGASLALMKAIPVSNSAGEGIGELQVETALIALKEIKLEALPALKLKEEGEPESDSNLDFEGPYIVNLVDNEVMPDPSEIDIPAGSYKKIELKMHKLEDEDASKLNLPADHPLKERSIYIDGRYVPNDGNPKSFTMTFELGEEFKIEDEKHGVELSAGKENLIIIVFDLKKWFDFSNTSTNSSKLDFSHIESDEINLNKDAEGVVAKLRETIKENIKESAEFGKDEDGDGKLGKDE